MLIPRSTLPGLSDMECATASVEEHLSCSCGCRTTESQCSPLQSFIPQECRCVCSDQEAITECSANNMVWDETLCQCLCLERTDWPVCPSGYAFNPSPTTCGCVPLSEIASTVLEILIVVLISSMAMTGFGILQCFRTKNRFVQGTATGKRPGTN